jgi:hypothetical protein
MKEQQKRNPKDQQHQSLRLGLEGRLKEKVVNAQHDASAQKKARNDRFATTGEGQCEYAGK